MTKNTQYVLIVTGMKKFLLKVVNVYLIVNRNEISTPLSSRTVLPPPDTNVIPGWLVPWSPYVPVFPSDNGRRKCPTRSKEVVVTYISVWGFILFQFNTTFKKITILHDQRISVNPSRSSRCKIL